MITIRKYLHSHVMMQYYRVVKEPDTTKRFAICKDIANEYAPNPMLKLAPLLAIPLISAFFVSDEPAIYIPCGIGALVIIALWHLLCRMIDIFKTTMYVQLVELTRRDLIMLATHATLLAQTKDESAKEEINDFYKQIVIHANTFCEEEIAKNTKLV